MTRKIGGMAAAALSFALSTTAAAADRGWYFGISGGKAELDVSKDELDQSVTQIFLDSGVPVLSGASTFDDSDTSWSIFAGYSFSRYFSVEAGYVDLGVREYRSSGTADPLGPVDSAPVTFNADFEASGLTLAGIGRLPLGEKLDLHASVGVLFASSEVRTAATVGANSGNSRASAHSRELFLSAGTAYNFNEHWSVSADWRGYQDVGAKDTTDEADFGSINLAVIFRF